MRYTFARAHGRGKKSLNQWDWFCGESLKSSVLMQIISWHIRDMGSSIKKRFLFKLIRKRKPDMVCLQETKLESVDRLAIQKIWGGNNIDFACSSSVGASGV